MYISYDREEREERERRRRREEREEKRVYHTILLYYYDSLYMSLPLYIYTISLNYHLYI